MPIPDISTIGKLLNAGEVVVDNTIGDAEIKKRMAEYGYIDAKMAGLRKQLDKLRRVVEDTATLKSSQKNKKEATDRAKKEAVRAFQDVAVICRTIFKEERSLLTQLALDKRMPATTDEFLKAGFLMFDNILNNSQMKTALGEYGYTIVKLQAERGRVAALDKAYKQQVAAKGDYQQSARDEREQLKAFKRALGLFFKVAMRALRDRPDLMEKLGMIARSKPVRKKKEAAQPGGATNPKA